MSLYVYGGPTTPVPGGSSGDDLALGVVLPNAPARIQTPTHHAGVSFPTGAVNEPTIVVISQNPTHYQAECSGPLDTHLCQWPQFYTYNVFPDVRLNQSAMVAVCHVNSGSFRNPREGIHDRFRLAHDKPAEGSRVKGGTIVDNIEILPFVRDATLIDCTENDSYSTIQSDIGLLDRGLRQLDRFAARIGRLIAPKSAYAIDQGGGGLVDLFSNFNVVDPDGLPDLQVGAPPTVDGFEHRADGPVTISGWNIANFGDATAGGFTSSIVIAQDTGLTVNPTTLGALATTDSLIKGQSAYVAGQTVTIPSNMPAGVYYIGVRVDNGGTVTESNENNNTFSIQISVSNGEVILSKGVTAKPKIPR
jgi:hypothetical protein